MNAVESGDELRRPRDETAYEIRACDWSSGVLFRSDLMPPLQILRILQFKQLGPTKPIVIILQDRTIMKVLYGKLRIKTNVSVTVSL